MAFTGSATVKKVSDRIYRITGLSLAGAASGTISLSGGTGDVKLPETPTWNKYDEVGLDDSIDVTSQPVTGVATRVPVTTVKTGDGPTDWLCTMTNGTGGTASGNLEIYLKFHD